MVQIDKYFLPPTTLIPNSSYPLLHYRNFISADPKTTANAFYDLLADHGWRAQWIFRYGKTQTSHYHSLAHECMVVLTGTATIRFGVADTVEDMDENTYGSGREEGGVEVQAHAGDVFVIPAGVAHKTYDAQPANTLQLLTPGDGHGLPPDFKGWLQGTDLSGFTMMGSYPADAGPWDFAVGGEGAATYANVWATLPPKSDPLLGQSEEGLCHLWNLPSRAVPNISD